jgi:hypothetical protein
MTSVGHYPHPLEHLTESDLRLLMEEPLAVQAEKLENRVIQIERSHRRTFTEIGLIYLYFEEKALFRLRFDREGNAYTSFNKWASTCAELVSRSYGYEAKEKIRILRDSGTNLDELKDVPRCNVETLAMLPPQVLREEKSVIKDAQQLSEDAFRSKMKREYPEAHIEDRKRTTFKFEEGVLEVVEEAIKLAMTMHKCSRQAAVECIFAEWLVAQKQESEIVKGKVAHA